MATDDIGYRVERLPSAHRKPVTVQTDSRVSASSNPGSPKPSQRDLPNVELGGSLFPARLLKVD